LSIILNTLAKIAGVCGFFASIFIFILTRCERRKRAAFFTYITGKAPQELELPKDSLDPYIVIQVTNSSPRPITVNTESLRVATSAKNVISKDLQWFVAGKEKGQFRKLSQADELRFFTRFSEFLGVIERLGYSTGKVTLSLSILDSEKKRYRAKTKYDLDNLRIDEKRTEVIEPEPETRWVHFDYPKQIGLEAQFESEGYRIAWILEEELSRKIIDGWEPAIVAERGKRNYLKIKNRPSNLILVKRLRIE